MDKQLNDEQIIELAEKHSGLHLLSEDELSFDRDELIAFANALITTAGNGNTGQLNSVQTVATVAGGAVASLPAGWMPEDVREKAINTILWFYRRAKPNYGRLLFAEEAIGALRAAPQVAPAQPVAQVPAGYTVKLVEGHGWIVDSPNGGRWIAFEDTPCGDFMKALVGTPAQPNDCARSHPHENMSADCEAKTIEARRSNALAQVAQPSAVTEPDDDPAFCKWREQNGIDLGDKWVAWSAWCAALLSGQRDTTSKDAERYRLIRSLLHMTDEQQERVSKAMDIFGPEVTEPTDEQFDMGIDAGIAAIKEGN